MATSRILILESDLKSRYALSTVLRDRGFDVADCDSPRSVDALSDGHFDVAILEIGRTDAPAAATARRILQANPRARLIFVTSYDRLASISAEFPAAEILVKPLDMERLFSLL